MDSGDEDGVQSARYVNGVDGWKDSIQSGGHGVDQAAIARGTADIDGQNAIIIQMSVYFLEELACGEVLGDIGYLVCIKGDHVVGTGQLVELVTTVAGDQVDIGLFCDNPEKLLHDCPPCGIANMEYSPL